jgi:CRP/FNR family cyclic AMP-dependent transcriptional regulator
LLIKFLWMFFFSIFLLTTRSRVSFFMNRFRKLGFIDYNGGIHVNKSLLNVVLHDQPSEHDAQKPALGSSEGFI